MDKFSSGDISILNEYGELAVRNQSDFFRSLIYRGPRFSRQFTRTMKLALDEKRATYKKGAQKQVIRVAVIGAGFNQEAISLAILLEELLDREAVDRSQVDYEVIVLSKRDLVFEKFLEAKPGEYPVVYPGRIMKNVSEERRAKYFIQTPQGYQPDQRIARRIQYYPVDLVDSGSAKFDPSLGHLMGQMDFLSVRKTLMYLKTPEGENIDDETYGNVLRFLHALLAPGRMLAIDDWDIAFRPRIIDEFFQLQEGSGILYRKQPLPLGPTEEDSEGLRAPIGPRRAEVRRLAGSQTDRASEKVKKAAMLQDYRTRFSNPVKRGSRWMRVSAGMKKAYFFQRLWERATDQTLELEHNGRRFLIDADVLQKAAVWFEGLDREFERKYSGAWEDLEGPFHGQHERVGYFSIYEKSGVQYILDFFPHSSCVLDPEGLTEDTEVQEALLSFPSAVADTHIPISVQKALGLIDEKYSLEFPGGMQYRRVHSHPSLSGPSASDQKYIERSGVGFNFLYGKEGWDTFYLGANTPARSVLQTVEEQKADLKKNLTLAEG